MSRIVSYCRFAAMDYEHHYVQDQPSHSLLIKATFDWDDTGKLTPAEGKPKLLLQETLIGEPDRSSILYPADLTPRKPMTDILVVGHAVAPEGRPTASWDAGLAIGNLRKKITFHGPRAWQNRLLGGWTLSKPEPVESVRLCYELAYGGHRDAGEEREWWPHNPLGRGFMGQEKLDSDRVYPAAQIEYSHDRLQAIDRPIAVAGLGPMNDYFEDRMQFAGTYDDRHDPVPGEQPPVSPHIPDDFKLDFWQHAPLDQRIGPYLKGGEVLNLVGLTASGQLSLKLPQYRMRAVLKWYGGDSDTQLLDLDTVLVDLDRRQLQLRWYGVVPFDEALEEIALLDLRDVVAPYRKP